MASPVDWIQTLILKFRDRIEISPGPDEFSLDDKSVCLRRC